MRKRVGSVCVLAALWCGCSAAQNIASTWQGTFQTGSEQRRVVLEMAKDDHGAWKATELDVEFFHGPMNVDSLTLDGGKLHFATDGGKGSYTGKISADVASIDGTWSYDQQSTSLVLRRTSKDAAWRTPFEYQYHYRTITYARPSPDEAKIPFSPKLAVDYMEQGALAWTKDWQCVACHTNGSYMVVRPLMTPQLGPPQKEMRDYFVTALREQMMGDPDDPKWKPEPTQVVYIAAGLAIWDAHVTHRLSPETGEALNLMFKLQRDTGDWFIEDDTNPPLESSTYQLATVAARAVGNAPGWLKQQAGTPVEARVNRLVNFLRAGGKMQGNYDRTDLLWAAAEFPGLLDARLVQDLVEMVEMHQRADGGWSIRTFAKPEQWGKGNRAEKLRAEPEMVDPQSDGHMTGLAIIALRKAGVPASDPHIQRGVGWLLANQRASGRWWTRSLNRDGWQFISYSGTAYPMLALAMCDALPARLQTWTAAGN